MPLTDDDLLKILKGEGKCSSTTSDDHPEFKNLREMLGEQEFISINRNSWNGDKVLKPFSLNGAKFKVGEMFACGGAMSYAIPRMLKYQARKSNKS